MPMFGDIFRKLKRDSGQPVTWRDYYEEIGMAVVLLVALVVVMTCQSVF